MNDDITLSEQDLKGFPPDAFTRPSNAPIEG